MLSLRTAIVCGILLFAGSTALADVIHLSSGGKVRGKIIKESSRSITVEGLGGKTIIPRSEIERIERGLSPEQAYKKKLKKIDKQDPDDRVKLGKWMLKKHNARELSRREFKAAIELDADHAEARKQLGYVREGGQWVRTSGEKASAKKPKKSARAKLSVPTSPALNDAAKAARGKTPEKRADAFAQLHDDAAEVERLMALLTAPEPGKVASRIRSALAVADASAAEASGEALRSHVETYVREQVRPAVTEEITLYGKSILRRHKWVDRRLEGLLKDYKADDSKRADALAAWVKTRDAALTVIFDKTIYPDANHGRSGQPTVDEHVDRVRPAWAKFDAMIRKDVARVQALKPEDAQAMIADVNEVYTRLKEVNAALEERGAAPFDVPVTTPIHWALLTYQAGDLNASGGVSGLSDWEAELMRRMRDDRVLAFNASFAKKNPYDYGKGPSGQEIEQVRITNEYRIMMGRQALEIDPRLVDSARGHSADMTRLGFFAHESPVSGKRNPSDRMRAAGYPSVGGENISLGSVSPKATHIAWYNSSGHHRNILATGYWAMGSGLDGQHWTQNFGNQGTLAR